MISAEEKHGRVSVFSRMVQALSAPVAVVLDNVGLLTGVGQYCCHCADLYRALHALGGT